VRGDGRGIVSGDPEMLELAQEEAAMLQEKISELEERLRILLLPKDPLDDKNIMLEALLSPPPLSLLGSDQLSCLMP
jgi:protein subunit release factor A